MRSNVRDVHESSRADGTGTYASTFATIFDGPLMPYCQKRLCDGHRIDVLLKQWDGGCVQARQKCRFMTTSILLCTFTISAKCRIDGLPLVKQNVPTIISRSPASASYNVRFRANARVRTCIPPDRCRSLCPRGDVGFIDRREAPRDRVVEGRGHKLVADLGRATGDVMQTVVTH